MIVAIDQGSTKTQVLVGNAEGEILGVGLAEGACHFHDGMAASMHAVSNAAENALVSAGLTWDRIHSVSAGMSGANWPDEVESLRLGLAGVSKVSNIAVYNDSIVALRAGSNRDNAVVLCAGTDFNAAVRKDGAIIWIYNNFVEEEDKGGSGLSLRALRSIFRSITRMGEETALAKRALDYFGYSQLHDLLLDFDRGTLPMSIKGFAESVDEVAAGGDAVALNVMYEYGISLSRYATAAIQRFKMLDCDTDVVLTGGIFKASSRALTDAICTQVHRIAPKADIIQARFEPVVGAYQLALEATGHKGWPKRLIEAAGRHCLYRIPD